MGLTTGLAAYYNLDEASGQRNDSHTNALHLTDNNTVGSAAGVGTGQVAADFVNANDEYLNHIDDNAFRIGDRDWTAVLWVRPEGGSELHILKKGDSTGHTNTPEYVFGLNTSDQFVWFCEPSGGGAASQANDGITRSFNEWYFVEMGHDAANDEIFISVNRAAPTVDAIANGVAVTTEQFALGWWTSTITDFDGRIQSVGIWHRLLTTEEKDKLYNGGTAALLYSDLAFAETVGTSAGSSIVNGQLSKILSCECSAAGLATVSGETQLLKATNGISNGIATVNGESQIIKNTELNANGISTADANMGAFALTEVNAEGTSTVNGQLNLIKSNNQLERTMELRMKTGL